MELAGHSCIETTMTYYTKSSSKLLNQAILALQNGREGFENTNVSIDNSMICHNSKRALK
jgi:hypothetical protein